MSANRLSGRLPPGNVGSRGELPGPPDRNGAGRQSSSPCMCSRSYSGGGPSRATDSTVALTGDLVLLAGDRDGKSVRREPALI